MFFLSGVVTYRSILTKGKPRFIKDRLLRIGLPFVVAELIIIPLAYLPPYFINTKEPGLWHFVQDYLFHQSWPVGPPWFLWLLLLFNLLILIHWRCLAFFHGWFHAFRFHGPHIVGPCTLVTSGKEEYRCN